MLFRSPTRECDTEKQSFMSTLGKDIKDIGHGMKGFLTGGPETRELDELARLAGLKNHSVDECNYTTEGNHCPVHGLAECGGMFESKEKKADKDYDGDGEVESEKDEVWGSRAKAAAKAGKPFKESAKPDFLDLDKDGNKTEPMKQAAKQAKPKKKEVDETTVSGSVATATAAPKSSKGMQFGKGIYDSLNREVESIISEGMNISVNMSQDENGEPHKDITVNASGDDAEQLAQILRLSGLKSDDHETCDTCGSSPCGCEQELDENHPDWPTDSETSGDALQYSGGLNGPKSTGQTTIPVLNTEPRRQHANEDLGLSLYKELKSFQG